MDDKRFVEHLSNLGEAQLMDQLLKIQNDVLGHKEIYAISKFITKIMTHSTIVDLGCGPGYFLENMASRCPDNHYIGLDNNDYLLSKARRMHSKANCNINVENCDIVTDDLKPYVKNAQIVFSRYTLQYIKECKSLLQKIYKWMNKGSIFLDVEAVYSYFGEIPRSGKYSEFIDRLMQAYKSTGSEYNMSVKLPLILRNAGFEEINTEILFHSNINIRCDDFLRMVLGVAALTSKMFPELISQDFVYELEVYIREKYEDVHMYMATAIVYGMKT